MIELLVLKEGHCPVLARRNADNRAGKSGWGRKEADPKGPYRIVRIEDAELEARFGNGNDIWYPYARRERRLVETVDPRDPSGRVVTVEKEVITDSYPLRVPSRKTRITRADLVKPEELVDER